MSEDAASSESQVIVVGGGLSGLATALGAALRGRRVTVFESAGLLGGAAAYSGGQVWVGANHVAERHGIHDDLARAERYVTGIAHARPELLDAAAMRQWLTAAPEAMRHWEQAGAVRWTVICGLADYHADVPGASAGGRYLTAEPVAARSLGPWRGRLRISPYFGMGTTYSDLFERGRRQTAARPDTSALTFGTGLVAGFLAKVIDHEKVDILTSHRVTQLVTGDDGTVTGTRADGPAGPVRRDGPVVLATSTYDWDAELVKEFLGLAPDDFGSMAPETLLGDGIRLARSAGGTVEAFPAGCVPLVPGWLAPGGFENGPEYAMPHAMMVDAAGRRFCDDSYWVSIVPAVTGPRSPHRPFFLIIDDQHRQKYGLGSTPPGGGEYPEGMVCSAPTLRELGQVLGADGEQLEATAAEFSRHAERGEDPHFGRGGVEFIRRFSGDPSHRPNPLLGPIRVPPFHGLRLRLLGTGIGSSGVRIDADGRVLSQAGTAIRNLYAVGSCAAATTFGTGYNSGFALSRGLTLAYLVAGQL